MNAQDQGRIYRVPNFFEWWLVEEPIKLWVVTGLITKRVLIFFSIPVLLRTLFAPWKRDVQTPVNMSLDLVVRVIIDNVISRVIGFIIRFLTIVIGLSTTLICFVLGMILMLFWFFLPLLVLGLLWWGWA